MYELRSVFLDVAGQAFHSVRPHWQARPNGCLGYLAERMASSTLRQRASGHLYSSGLCRRQYTYSYDAGINTFDTANIYSNGLSEEILGEAIQEHRLPRDEIGLHNLTPSSFRTKH